MSDAPGRIVPSCVEALENYRQADMDGIMVLASRQAIHETIDAYWARVKTCEELEAKLAKAVGLVQQAFNEGFGSGMDDVLKSSGGRTWYDSRSRKRLAEINGGGDE